jgi:menaquinone-dependent protoporphyrinogen oxidase
MSARVLIVYGTSYGQTARIARRIADALERHHLRVELRDAAKETPAFPLDEYGAIVVGTSLIARGHQPAIVRFVTDHVDALNRAVSVFYQVSASAGSANPRGRQAAQRILDEFVRRLQWAPRLTASIAGAINYTKYNFLLRWYMKRASAKNGGATDTSRDHEYTNWDQVDQFAESIAALVPAGDHEPALD